MDNKKMDNLHMIRMKIFVGGDTHDCLSPSSSSSY